ncbi:bud site selection protein, partial [Perkinsus chesapeaki]
PSPATCGLDTRLVNHNTSMANGLVQRLRGFVPADEETGTLPDSALLSYFMEEMSGIIKKDKKRRRKTHKKGIKGESSSSSIMVVDETEDIPQTYNNDETAAIIDDDDVIVNDDDDMAPIVVDQWGNSLRPLRKDDLNQQRYINNKDDGDVSNIVDEAVEGRKDNSSIVIKREQGDGDTLNEEEGDRQGISDDDNNNNTVRLKEEYNDDEEEDNRRYDSDSDQSVVRDKRISIKPVDDDDDDQSPMRRDDDDESAMRRDDDWVKGLTVMSSGMTAGLVSGEDINKQMEEAKERRKIKLQHLPDEVTGKGAETVFRIGGRIVTEKEAIEEVKAKSGKNRSGRQGRRPEATKPEWAGGIKQDEILDEKAEHMARVMSESVRREGIDDIIDEELKNKQRIDDPLTL